MLKQEFAKVKKNRLLMITLTVVMLIPSIYSTIFLKSMWDTYERMDNFPVAVVNQDKEAEKLGKKINIGEELSKTLDESSDMDFQSVSADEAREGLNEGKYFMAITIPEDFSADSMTLMDKEPKQMNLTYETSAGHNFTASKFSEIAAGRIKNEVQNNVTRTYAQTVLGQFKKAGLGLEQAGDGAKTLANGLTQLSDGSGKLQDGATKLNNGLGEFGPGLATYTNGVGTAADGTQKLAAGGSQLQSGINQYTGGVNQAAANVPALAQGINQYTAGVEKAKDGVQQYTAGVAKAQVGSKKVSDGSKKLSDGLAELNLSVNSADVKTLTDGMAEYKQQVGKLKQMSSGASPEQVQIMTSMEAMSDQIKVLGGLAQSKDLTDADRATLGKSIGELATNLKSLETSLKAQAGAASQLGALADGYNKLYAGMSGYVVSTQGAAAQLAPGAKDLAAGATELNGGLSQLTGKNAELNGGLSQLTEKNGQLNAGTNQLAGGLAMLQSKSGDLQNGTSQAVGGINQLNAGLGQLNANSGRLQSAVDQLGDGSSQLATGAGQLNVGLVKANDGADELGSKLTEGGEQVKQVRDDKANLDMFATPITETHKDRTTVKNNGTGMAPYMIAIYVFVGMITLMAAMNLTEPASYPKSSFTWWLSKYTIPFVIVFLGAIITTLVSISIIGLTPVNTPAFLISLIVIAIMDMSIVYFFTAAFGKIGTFISLILLVLQLSGSGGTYPIELSSEFFQWLHPLLPMTYAIEALRGSLSTGLSVTEPVTIMFLIFVTFSLLSWAYFAIQKSKRYRFEDSMGTDQLDNN